MAWYPAWNPKGWGGPKGFGKGAWAWQGWGGAGGKWGGPKRTVDEGFVVDGDARYTGKVSAYWKFKGCGFIELTQKGVVPEDKVFVYWKNIQSEDRFPCLTQGLEVEFGIQKMRSPGAGRGKAVLRAKHVTQVGGATIALQDEADAEKKTFVGGQNLRYTGKLKFFSPRNGFGYILLDEGYAVDAEVPKELRVETTEVNAGTKQARVMKDLAVEFGIWKTKRGAFKAYNMTLPGGVPMTQEALENRHAVADRTFKGKIGMWNWKSGYGLITAENPETFPPEVTAKIAEMNKAVTDKGRKVHLDQALYFRKADCQQGFRPQKDVAVTFSIYTDDKGAGACNIN